MNFSKEDIISRLAILVIIVSLLSIGMELTGYAVEDTARVDVTIESTVAINFTTDVIDFGSGSVNNGSAGASLETGVAGAVDGTWTGTESALTLENIGNVNVSLSIESNKDAATYLGGTSPTFKYKVTDVETGSCVGNGASSYTSFTTDNVTICDTLIFNDATDSIDIDIELYIPSDSKIGEQSATITATGTST